MYWSQTESCKWSRNFISREQLLGHRRTARSRRPVPAARTRAPEGSSPLSVVGLASGRRAASRTWRHGRWDAVRRAGGRAWARATQAPPACSAPTHRATRRRRGALALSLKPYTRSLLCPVLAAASAALSDSVSLSAARLTPLVLTPRNGQGAPKIKIESTRLAKLNAAYKHPVVHTLHQRTV